MSRRSPYRIALTAAEREALEGTLRRPSANQAAAQRARIVLLAPDPGRTSTAHGGTIELNEQHTVGDSQDAEQRHEDRAPNR